MREAQETRAERFFSSINQRISSVLCLYRVYTDACFDLYVCMFVTCVYNNLIILHNLTVNLLCHICIDCEIHCLDFRQLFASQGAAEPRQINTIRTSEDRDREGEEVKSEGTLRFIWFDYLANISIQKLMYLTAA